MQKAGDRSCTQSWVSICLILFSSKNILVLTENTVAILMCRKADISVWSHWSGEHDEIIFWTLHAPSHKLLCPGGSTVAQCCWMTLSIEWLRCKQLQLRYRSVVWECAQLNWTEMTWKIKVLIEQQAVRNKHFSQWKSEMCNSGPQGFVDGLPPGI